MYRLASLLVILFSSSVIATDEPVAQTTEPLKSSEEIERPKAQTAREKRQENRNEIERSDIIPSKGGNPNAKWDRFLPFFGQQVIAKGYDLPLPLSISIIPNYSQQDLGISNLRLSYKDTDIGELLDLDSIDFGQPDVESASIQLRAAAWIFPFMQVGVHGGRFEGSTDLYVKIPTAIFKKIEEVCGGRVTPAFCDDVPENIELPKISPDYSGWNYGFTTNFVYGFSHYFILVPFSYTWSETDDNRTNSETLLVSARVGTSFQVQNWGIISPYIGASYMDTQGTSSQSDAEVSGGPSLEGLSYTIDQENITKYAGLIGFDWSLTKHHAFDLEANIGDGRQNYVAIYTFKL
jgi:hypothetical protein